MIALLIIDQQKGIDSPKLGERNNLNAEEKILNILSEWRIRDWPIFHIQHHSTDPNSVFWPQQEGVELKPKFEPQNDEKLITKSVPCAFTNNNLEAELASLAINSVVITGVATNNSVEATARTASNLGLNVQVVEDACFCFAKRDYFGNDRSASDVHAMSLANLDGEYATVINSKTLFER